MKRFVFDTSAIIAYIFQEKGGENVAKYLSKPIISSVNYSELIAFILKNGSKLDFLEDFLEGVDIEIVEFNE